MQEPPPNPASPGLLPYLNLVQGLRLDYPADWIVRQQGTPNGFAVYFGSPQESPDDRFQENVVLNLEAIPPGMNVMQYFQGNMVTMKQAPLQFLETKPAKLAGLDAYSVVYTGPLGFGQPLSGKSQLWVTVKGNKGYNFTYTAQLGHFDTFLPQVQLMLTSLQIK